MRGADCWTDHHLLRSKLALRVRPPMRKRPANKKLNCAALGAPETAHQLQETLHAQLCSPLPPGIEEGWQKLSKTVMNAAEEVLGRAPRKNQDWFDANLQEIREVISTKNKALAVSLSNPSSTYLKQQYKDARSNSQRILRRLENEWWLKLSADIQAYADSGDLQNFHSALKQAYGPSYNSLAPVRSRDGDTLHSENDLVS